MAFPATHDESRNSDLRFIPELEGTSLGDHNESSMRTPPDQKIVYGLRNTRGE